MSSKENKEKEKTSRETLGKFLYDLAKMTFGTTVLGQFVTVFGLVDFTVNSVAVLIFGSFVTYGFAYLGNVVLKDMKIWKHWQ